MGVPNRGWDRCRLAIFDRYISETVQDSDIEQWNVNRNSYVLYRMVLFSVTLSDPKPPHFPHFYRLTKPNVIVAVVLIAVVVMLVAVAVFVYVF